MFSHNICWVWRWLPAFQAVASTQHLPTAAERMLVTVSALSRTIKHLEEQLGEPVFERVGRRLSLNERGRTLLEATEVAMRAVESGLE